MTEYFGNWISSRKEIFKPFNRRGINWYIGKEEKPSLILYSHWNVSFEEFIDKINKNGSFNYILPFGRINKNLPITTRILCTETTGYKSTDPFTPLAVVMNDFLPELYVQNIPTFFVKGTKGGIITTSHPFLSKMEFPDGIIELYDEMAMVHKLWYPEIKFYFFPFKNGNAFNKFPKFFPFPIYPTSKRITEFSPISYVSKELIFYGESNNHELINLFNCFEKPFYEEKMTDYIKKLLPEFSNWYNNEFLENLERAEDVLIENLYNRDDNKYNHWIDDPIDFWNID